MTKPEAAPKTSARMSALHESADATVVGVVDGRVSGPPHVLVAMNQVSAALAVEGIGKDRENQQQRFKFRGIDDVHNALAPLLAKSKLIVVPAVTSREMTERESRQGGLLFNVVVWVTYTFVSATDGSQFTVGPFPGEAMDSGDKATNKAMSAAYKYMAIETFCIPTEGDNDADATTHEVVARQKPSPKETPPENQTEVRPAAKGFVDKHVTLIRSALDADAAKKFYDEAKAAAGWTKLTEFERNVIIVAFTEIDRFLRADE